MNNEDQDWYLAEKAFLCFLFTLDELGVSRTLHEQLTTFAPDTILSFLSKHKKDFVKGIVLL